MAQESEYKKMYIQEGEELLQRMNESLLVLEKSPKDKGALNALFRAAHTLKSMSASMGHIKISDLAHKMEDVLEKVRSEKVAIDEKIVDLLFKCLDLFELMAEQVANDKPADADTDGLISALDAVLGTPRSIPEEKVGGELSLNVFEKKTLAKAKKEEFNVFHLKIALEKQCVLKSVRVFMVFRNLHAIGEVVKSIPESRLIEEEKFGFEFGCVFVTKAKKDAVKKNALEVLEIESVEVNDVAVDEAWDIEVGGEKAMKGGAEEQLGSQLEHLKKMQSVRVDIRRLDKLMNLVEELTIAKLRLIKTSESLKNSDLTGIVELLNNLIDELQTEVMQARLVPVGQIFERFPRMVRDIAKKEGKEVALEVHGGDIELDRLVLDEIGDPLIHILRNSIDHGIESPSERESLGKSRSGNITLSAKREKSHVFISVEDDGKGMDVEAIRTKAVEKGLIRGDVAALLKPEDVLMFTTRAGFSTKDKVTEVSGRGVGLDVAKKKVEDLGGGIVLETAKGKGSKITLRLPITTAVIQALMVDSLSKTFAIPISSIVEIVVVNKGDVKEIEHQETILHRDRVLPIVRLDSLFGGGVAAATDKTQLNIVIAEFGAKQFGIVVDRLQRQQDIVVKQLTKELKGIRGFAGATILGDGNVALVLDVATLV